MNQDWKLKLKYGKLKTPYKHFTVLGDGIVGKLLDGFECEEGKAWMGMKTWAESAEQSIDMLKFIGGQIGFEVTADIQVFESEPVDPPEEEPYGYDIKFTPYK